MKNLLLCLPFGLFVSDIRDELFIGLRAASNVVGPIFDAVFALF